MKKICTLKFNAQYCTFHQNTKKSVEAQVNFCRNLRCPHGTVIEKIIDEETFALVSCDLSWNAIDNRETTREEREYMCL